MKLLTYSRDGADQVGVLASDQTSVIPLRALGCPVSSMQQLIEIADRGIIMRSSRRWVVRHVRSSIVIEEL